MEKHSLLIETSKENVGWIQFLLFLLFIQLNQNDFKII